MSTDQPLEETESIVRPTTTPSVYEPSVGAINIKIPPFWPADPQIWFAQVEAQFSTRGITSQRTKFDHIVASLSPEFAQEVRDLILSPPTTTPYDILRTQLISRTEAPEQRRLQQLFHAEELGDRKPTQLLRRMEQLMGDKATIDNSFFRELFLQRLPTNVRMILASTDSGKTLADLAQLADKVMEVAAPPISSVTTTRLREVDQLRTETGELRKLVEKLIAVKQPPRSRTLSCGRSPSPASTSPPQPTVCWYHQKFGSAAQKCRSPCSQSPGNDQASH